MLTLHLIGSLQASESLDCCTSDLLYCKSTPSWRDSTKQQPSLTKQPCNRQNIGEFDWYNDSTVQPSANPVCLTHLQTKLDLPGG